VLALVQLRLRVVQVRHRVRDVVAIGERQHADAGVRAELAAHPLGHPGHPRHRERHHAVAPRHVRLPADPGHRVAGAHQEAVAEVLARGRVVRPGRAVEHAERDLAAAVRHIQEEAAIASAGGAKEIEVRGGLDEPLGIARGQAQIGDGLIGAQ